MSPSEHREHLPHLPYRDERRIKPESKCKMREPMCRWSLQSCSQSHSVPSIDKQIRSEWTLGHIGPLAPLGVRKRHGFLAGDMSSAGAWLGGRIQVSLGLGPLVQ